MHTTVAYMGDVADSRPAQLATAETTEVHCLVWEVDLSGAGRLREARRILRAGADDALTASRAFPELKHLVITYRCAGEHRRRVRFTAQSVARRLHSAIERARGRYMDIVAIDLSGIDHRKLLTQRLSELASVDGGIVGYAAIPWEDLRSESIRDTCTRDVI